MQVKLTPISTLNVNVLNSDEYIATLNDPEANKYLECRFQSQTLSSVLEYIESLSDNVRFFKIISKEHLITVGTSQMPVKPVDTWVGNIKLGPINWIHRFAEIGILIFPKYWNKGYATEAIKLISNYAFGVLHLHKLFAGCLEPNIASIKAFKKAGFTHEYTIKNQYLVNENGYVDDLVLSKYNIKEKEPWSTATSASFLQQDLELSSIVQEFAKPASTTQRERVSTGVQS